MTLDAPISSTASLAEIAEELVRTALADHPDEKKRSLAATWRKQLLSQMQLRHS
jgi:DNA polymerase-4